ncbi:hypothetical protein WD019_16070 [Fictibacillus sp. Mic-4]|uniref:hypothetical protein n=1 Tax=Fictibacillus sp. Mic-4 TaxID=3132826 RepID=UPI003CF08902
MLRVKGKIKPSASADETVKLYVFGVAFHANSLCSWDAKNASTLKLNFGGVDMPFLIGSGIGAAIAWLLERLAS